jgi:cytochrome bd-type quinol oxidase subunit 2
MKLDFQLRVNEGVTFCHLKTQFNNRICGHICNVMLVMCNVVFLLILKTSFQGKEKQELKTKKKIVFFVLGGVKICHLVTVKMDMQRAKRLFLDKIAQILPNFNLKNINSTCTKDLS